MYFSIHIIRYRYVIDHVIAIKVKVIDPGIFIIQVPFKSFQCFRFLKQVHHSVEVKVISRQTKVFFGPVLCTNKHRCCCKDCKYRYGKYSFHGFRFLDYYLFNLIKAKGVPNKKPDRFDRVLINSAEEEGFEPPVP